MRLYKDLVTVLIENLPYKKDKFGNEFLLIDEDFLKELFADYKIIDRFDVIRFKKKKISMDKVQFNAYVKFESLEEAEKAIKEMNFTKLDKFEIQMMVINDEVKECLKDHNRQVVIKNLLLDIENSQMFESMSSFGKVIKIKTKLEDDNSSKCSIVYFQSENDAARVVHEFQGASINGQLVSVSLYNPT